MDVRIPMLLGVYDEKLLTRCAKWYISEKYDGWRVTVQEGKFYSRRGKLLNVPSYLAEEVKQYGDLMLDGELWHGYDGCGIGVHNEEPEDQKDWKDNKMTYLVYDAPETAGIYQERLQILRKKSKGGIYIKCVEQKLIKNNEIKKIEEFYQGVIKRGGEGIVIKPYDMMYEWNHRQPLFMKKKPWDTANVIILDYYTTKGKIDIEGYVSSYICKMDDHLFKVTCKTLNPLPKGTSIMIKYSHYTMEGLPKFPQMLWKLDKPLQKADQTYEGRKNTQKYKTSIVIPPIVKTTVEWKKLTTVLKTGEKVGVKNDKGIIYVVARAVKNDSIYCTCESWKYQKALPTLRTCKHCIAVCGSEAEKKRTCVM